MEGYNERTALLLGNNQVEQLKQAAVMVVGIGGVGSYCAEALARCGIGQLILVDHDSVSLSNLNRQIHANYETIGRLKTDVMKERILSYRKDCEVLTYPMFYQAELNEQLFQTKVDFVVDAIDTISAKLDLISYCLAHKISFISSMGMANRMDPTAVCISELMKTSYDPLAKVMRSQVRKRRIKGKIPVVYSVEQPIKQNQIIDSAAEIRKLRIPPASSPFVPAAAGLACAGYAVKVILTGTNSANTDRK